ncbi:MAG TPA: DUF948 domain-containing protein [bacterium]|nr:DUF948 domain-containing protein [bacterium]
MPNDLLTLIICATLIILSAVLLGLFTILVKGLQAQAEALRELRRDMLPALGEIRQTSQNLLAASEGLRQGMARIQHLTDALGDIGDDLELGHRGVKSGIKWASRLIGPWLGKLID